MVHTKDPKLQRLFFDAVLPYSCQKVLLIVHPIVFPGSSRTARSLHGIMIDPWPGFTIILGAKGWFGAKEYGWILANEHLRATLLGVS